MVKPLSAAILAALPLLAIGQGIVSPANGTHIAPGEEFAFTYSSVGDYCISSLEFTVFLFTSKPKSFSPAKTWATGYYFGRFSQPNTPGSPDPDNPTPATLTMPNFDTLPEGFGQGEDATNRPVYLTVLEEWAECTAAFGNRLALSDVTLIYNATTS